MSLSRRFVPQPVLVQPGVSSCQEGAANRVLQPPPVALYCLSSAPSSSGGRPLSFHTVSLLRVTFSFSLREVPPTATTDGYDAGISGLAGAASSSNTTSQS